MADAPKNTTRFGKGNPGKPKGARNKVTLAAKEMLEQAAEGAGGLETLTKFAKSNPEIFWPMWARLLPKNVDVGGQVVIQVRRT